MDRIFAVDENEFGETAVVRSLTADQFTATKIARLDAYIAEIKRPEQFCKVIEIG